MGIMVSSCNYLLATWLLTQINCFIFMIMSWNVRMMSWVHCFPLLPPHGRPCLLLPNAFLLYLFLVNMISFCEGSLDLFSFTIWEIFFPLVFTAFLLSGSLSYILIVFPIHLGRRNRFLSFSKFNSHIWPQ